MAIVTSKDGTALGYNRRGAGPAVILVDGALGYRQFGPMSRLAELLAPTCTVIDYDRRGRGESGDTPPHSLAREIEDLDALIAAVGGSASLCGFSSGACLAFEAAVELGSKVQKLALYEPPYNADEAARPEWDEYGGQLTALLARGRNGDAVTLFMRFVGTPPEFVEGMRTSPVWPTLEAVAPTLAYDRAAIGEDRRVPAERAARLAIPTLVMNGTLTLPFIVDAAVALAAAIPDGRHLALEGQSHEVNTDVLAKILQEFLAE